MSKKNKEQPIFQSYDEKMSDEFYNEYIANFKPNTKKRYFYRFIKRFFDIFLSSLTLIIISPIFLFIALAIKCDDGGKVIFAQERMGKNGKIFKCYKFRSMREDAPKNMATSLLSKPEKYYTKIGKFLRASSLDELPQFWNCFKGDMSFVGYRPLCLTEEKCNEMRAQLSVFTVRPGITGYAQILGRDNVYYKNKAILDSIYVQKANLWFDTKIMFQTFFKVLKREGNKSNDKTETKKSAD